MGSLNLAITCKTDKNSASLSGNVPRSDKLNEKVLKVKAASPGMNIMWEIYVL